MRRVILAALTSLALLLSACDAPLGTPPAGAAFIVGTGIGQTVP